MPELPEIYNLAQQMDRELKGKTIAVIEIIQEKCLNVTAAEFRSALAGKQIGSTRSTGKWIFTSIGGDTTFLLNLGMGGDILYHKPGEEATGKYRLKLNFTDQSALTINFWWFGYAHAVENQLLKTHSMTSTLGMSPIDEKFTPDYFRQLVEGKKCTVKTLLLDQKCIAGIGNVYAQDILFQARIHPNRKTPTLDNSEVEALYKAIQEKLTAAIQQRGLKFEKDLYGKGGDIESFSVGYREGQACPSCGAVIKKIKTGSTASYICPECQPELVGKKTR